MEVLNHAGVDHLIHKISDSNFELRSAIEQGLGQRIENTINITHAELVSLRDNAMLKPGQQYRITDYITTTTQAYTMSANHPFDIIVTAIDESTLSENASAIRSARDTENYFGTENLEAWQLKYCIDNDADRFAWIIDNSYKAEFVAMFWNDPTNGINYDHHIKNDKIYDWGTESDPETGIDNIVIYKSDTDTYIAEGSADYNDKYFYRGIVEVDGKEYDSWKKYEVEQVDDWITNNDGQYQYALTERIVFDGQVIWPELKPEIIRIYDSSNCVIKDEYDGGPDDSGYNALSEYIVISAIMMDDPINGDPYEALNKDIFSHYGYETEPNGGNSLYLLGSYLEFDEETGQLLSNDGLCEDQRYYYRGVVSVDGSDFDCWQKYNTSEGYELGGEPHKYYFLTNKIVDGDVTFTEFEKTDNRKGVIYNMIDEYGNECPYDFKNIQFKHPNDTTTYTDYYYTFSTVINGVVTDHSLLQGYCYDNTIKEYISSKKQKLNNNVFLNTSKTSGCFSNSFGNNCYENSFGNGCSSNSFEYNCNFNSFGNGCDHNSFENNCRSNSFGTYCRDNSFGNGCDHNSFENDCNWNSFGNGCDHNSFGDDCYSNTFENNCSSNSFGNTCYRNSFGNGCSSNSFGNYCQYNSFGNGCNNNSFGNGCDHNSFENNCRSNSFGNECESNSFGNGCNNNSFGDSCSWNSFGNYCYYNSFGHNCGNNSFENNCRSNSFGNECGSNSFGNYCNYNSFEYNCKYNSFGDSCSSNSFGNYCYENSFGNNCSSNSFENNCRSNSFGNTCKFNSFRVSANESSALKDYIQYNHFDDGCSYNIIWNSDTTSSSIWLKNINVNRGVSGTSGSYNYINISTLNSEQEINVNQVDGIVSIGEVLSIKYESLVALRNNGQLIPGRQYRIIDYVTKTSQENTQSANHPFDIIVTALDEYTLSEEAQAVQNENDGYFDESNLSAWKLWYCLDNDTNRFAWAEDEITTSEEVEVTTYDSSECTINSELIDGNSFITPFNFESCVWVDANGEDQTYEGESNHDAAELVYEWGYFTDENDNTQLCLYKSDAELYEEEGQPDYADKYLYRGIVNVDGTDYDYWQKWDASIESIDINGSGDYVYATTPRIVSNPEAYSFETTTETIETVIQLNPKGVIYRMIDEFNNDCPYDFKNIQFKRKLTNGVLDTENGVYTWCYTFNAYCTDNTTIYDASVIAHKEEIDDDTNRCYENIIKEYYVSVLNKGLKLNDIVFLNTYTHGVVGYFYCYCNSFGNDCGYNSFGNRCLENSFGNGCFNNSFGNGCHENSFGNGCHENSFGNGCRYNTFGNDCYSNSFGNNCSYNYLENSCRINSFGNNCYNNSFKYSCNGNKCGNYYQYNSLGIGCLGNSFGNYCKYNFFGNECDRNSFRVSADKTAALKDYVYYNHFDDGCSFNVIWNADTTSSSVLLKNINVNRGVAGTAVNVVYNMINIDTLNSEQEINVNQVDGIVSIGEVLHINYESLKSLRDNSQLIPGRHYRIIDYVTTTAQANIKLANHPFDLIVIADDESTLNEKARAIQHEGDEYFVNSDLAAWEIWYCLDNDAERFAWADAENGKGVIYHMIDEFNNDVPYDFKNIVYVSNVGFEFRQWGVYNQFGRNSAIDKVLNGVQYYGWTSGSALNGWSEPNCWTTVDVPSTDMTLYNTDGSTISFSGGGAIVSINLEYSEKFTFNADSADASLSLSNQTHNNTIRPYFRNEQFSLNNITFGNNCYNNSFGNNCYNNSFGNNCYNNSFGNSCHSNSFENNCYDNSFGSDCYKNSFDNSCQNNSFENNCYNNSFGNYCHSNSFENNCYDNSFGNRCQSNTFGDECYDNTFGDDCGANSFGYGCYSNTFGDECNNNSFDASCYGISFGDDCSNNSFDDSCQRHTFGNGCNSNSFGYGCSISSFGNGCSNNSFRNDCHNNSFGNNCYSNTFENNCSSNTFENNCSSNSFGLSCQNNSFGDDYRNNSFGNYCVSNAFGDDYRNNSFGNYCQYNSFGNKFYYNSFGNYCTHNSFGNSCYSNSFGNTCNFNSFRVSADESSALKDYVRYNHFDDGCSYNVIWNADTTSSSVLLKNISVNRGVSGTDLNYNYINIDTLNQDYEIQVAKNSKGEIKIYCEADLIA